MQYPQRLSTKLNALCLVYLTLNVLLCTDSHSLLTSQSSTKMPDTENNSGGAGGGATGGAEANNGGGVTRAHYRHNAKAPGPLDISGDDRKVNWEIHKQMWEYYTIASRLENEDARIIKAEFMNTLGPDTLRIVNGLGLRADAVLNDIIKELDNFCIGRTSEAVAHFLFSERNQKKGESVDTWIADLRVKQKLASFTHETMTPDQIALRNKIMCGVADKEAQEKMLNEGNPTLDRVIEIAKACEATKQYMKTMHKMEHQEDIHKIKTKRDSRSQHLKKRKDQFKKKHSQKPTEQPQIKKCLFCGAEHIMRKEDCPAYGKKCKACSGRNHFQGTPMCPKSKKVHMLEDENSYSDTDNESEEYSWDSEDTEEILAVSHNQSTSKAIYCEMVLGKVPIKFQIDCGATVNVIPSHLVSPSIDVAPTDVTLRMWNNSMVKPKGQANLKLRNPKTKKKYRVHFIVVEQNLTPILSRSCGEKMKLITVNYKNFKTVNSVSVAPVQDCHPDVFQENLGTFPGKVHLEINEDVQPVVCPPRRIPVALKARVKEKLAKMTKAGILEKVEEPSAWVSQMAVTTKKNGDLRICIDPRPLNKALKREHHMMPVLDDLLPELARAKVFSRLDLKDGYWHCVLDEPSSQLTTFQTPFGRFRWKRLPFGLNVSAEIFQKRLKETMEGLTGVECIADDILVWGVGETKEEAEKDHDKNLEALLTRAGVKGHQYKKAKCQFKTEATDFQGHVITANGLKADPNKVKAILEMKAPRNVAEVRILRGTINYMARFLPDLSSVIEPISRLVKEDVPWHWETEQAEAFERIKLLISGSPVLTYYDAKKELVLQCDASEKALGATLLQDAKPVAYASRALTEIETRYAQIEKEALSVAWSLEHFRQYTYGRRTIIHNDHKPLENILQKPLYRAPRRLQGILMKIIEYDTCFMWKPGKEVVIADLLSRSHPKSTGQMSEIEAVNMVKYLPIRRERLERLKTATHEDEVLQMLTATILEGWPTERALCMAQVTPYFNFRDELSVQDGLIFKGERLVIPASMRAELREALHEAHLGIESCLRRAREAIYWPGMNSDIRHFISSCDVCRTYETKQCKETLKPHDLPSRPWEKLGIDLFTVHGKDYLVTVDFFSDFWEIDQLASTTSTAIIHKLKAHFARNGIPEQVVSDNAPNLTSEEFDKFAQEWDFEHITTSPYHSQSNGKAESAVKAAKKMLRKARKSKTDPYLAMLAIRNTPTQGMDGSPMQRMNNRRGRTRLPLTSLMLQPNSLDTSKEKTKLETRQMRQCKYYNRSATDLPILEEGDTVRIKPTKGENEWKKGVISKKINERSYEVTTSENTYRRNRVDLKRTTETPPKATDETMQPPTQAKSCHMEQAPKEDPQRKTQDPKEETQPTNSPETLKTPKKQKSPTERSTPPGPKSNTTEASPAMGKDVRTRSGRASRMPKHLDQYVCK